jgi:hypothetical protein
MDKPTITATEVFKLLGVRDVSIAKVESACLSNTTKKQILHNAWSGEFTVTKWDVVVFSGKDAAEAIGVYNDIAA